MAAWLKTAAGGVVLNLRIVPRASRSETAGPLGDALKIRLQAPPVDGKANAALREFLAVRLNVPLRAVTLLSGETGRQKRVSVAGVTAAEVEGKLAGNSKR
jgi:uncharacterized protein (TIGR00251 family)